MAINITRVSALPVWIYNSAQKIQDGQTEHHTPPALNLQMKEKVMHQNKQSQIYTRYEFSHNFSGSLIFRLNTILGFARVSVCGK